MLQRLFSFKESIAKIIKKAELWAT